MAQNDGLVVDSLNRLQNQVNFNNETVKLDIYQLKRENDNLKRDNDFLNRDVDQLKRENIQIKFANDQLNQDINQMKQHNDLRFNSLNDEMHNMKSRIMDYFFRQTTTTPRLGNEEFSREPIDDITINQMPAYVPQMNVKAELDDASHSNVISNFSSLPDDAIRLILIRLPLRHRVMLRIVCHRWKSIIELMCKSVQFLNLYGPATRSLHYNKETDQNNLLLVDINRQVNPPYFHKVAGKNYDCLFIPQLFCNVNQVVLSFPKTFEITIMQLLESWTDRLTNLALDIDINDKYLGEAILHRIAQMPKLESFSLFNNYVFHSDIPKAKLNFLKQLKQLKINWILDNVDRIINSIGPNMRQLEMEALYADVKIFRAIENNSTGLAKVTHFKFNIVQYDLMSPFGQKHALSTICRRFVSLTKLESNFLTKVPFDEQLTELNQLVHLTELHLYLTSANLDRDLPSVQFASMHSLVLNIWMKPMTARQTIPKPVNIIERTRIGNFLNQIPFMFPVLKELTIVAHNNLTIQFIRELVNGSALMFNDRIKHNLTGN